MEHFHLLEEDDDTAGQRIVRHGPVGQPDPGVSGQWHFSNPNGSINVQGAWLQYSGEGVTVAVIDDGVDDTHPELQANYDATIDYDAYSGGDDGSARAGSDFHATAVAGLIAADNNGSGIQGVAPDANLTSIRLPFAENANSNTDLFTDSMLAGAFRAALNGGADVINNSWGDTIFFSGNFNSHSQQAGNAIQELATNGRGGLGTVVIFAGGNDRSATANNTNYSNYTNSPYLMTVGATDPNGNFTSFSNPGASLLVSAPGLEVKTTTANGGSGAISGTSFAAPIATGAAALMLEANSTLGFMDIQEIFAASAKMTGENDAQGSYDWFYNAAGYHFNHDYGFGLVDATAAVRLAETWHIQSTAANMTVQTYNGSGGQTIQEGGGATVERFQVQDDIDIDKVEVTVTIDHPYPPDLQMILVSPNGTTSWLMDRPGDGAQQNVLARHIDNYGFTSNAFWGESSQGEWQVQFYDHATGNTGTFSNISLSFYGDQSPDDVYVVTDDYANAPARQITDTDGGNDSINLAAVTSDSTLSLDPTQQSIVAGKTLTIDPNAAIEYVFFGIGNDQGIGSPDNDYFNGGAGKDILRTGAGDDVMVGGDGMDQLDGGEGYDVAIYTEAPQTLGLARQGESLFVYDKTIAAPDTGDTLTNIEGIYIGGALYDYDGAAGTLSLRKVYDTANYDASRATTIQVETLDTLGDDLG